MMVVIFASFAGGMILAGIAARISAASRRSSRLFRITPQAERQFLEDINRTHYEGVVTTIVEP
jgi:pantothenate kinase type III